MLSLNQLKRLDPKLKKLSPEELERARDLLYGLGELALSEWFKKSGSKNKSGSRPKDNKSIR
jgi:hypothetical protein